MSALVAHTLRPSPVVAARDLADPVRRVASHSCDGRGSHSTRQQPQKLPVAALDGVRGLAIALVQGVFAQIGGEADASWHAPVLQQSRVTRYKAGRAPGGARCAPYSLSL